MSTMPAPIARRRQPAITIRSAHAAARLAELTRDGRSQVEVIEEALDRMPLPPGQDRAAAVKRFDDLLASLPQRKYPTMEELDADFWDEDGLPR